MKFKPGLRLSFFDMVILAIAVISVIYLAKVLFFASFMVMFVIGHFFLFCNVFRVSRILEIIWAIVFVSASIMTLIVGYPGWILTVLISLVLSIGFIIYEIKSPSYHGIFWQRINPQLETWWRK